VATTDIEWVAVGYLLTYAAVIPAAGWLGDRFGTRRVFIGALIAFVAASLLCGLAQTLDQLVVFRLLQGVGAGLVTPIGAAMLYRAFPMEERARAAIGVLSVAVIAPAIGPMLGGILVDTVSWHWIFLINVPIAPSPSSSRRSGSARRSTRRRAPSTSPGSCCREWRSACSCTPCRSDPSVAGSPRTRSHSPPSAPLRRRARRDRAPDSRADPHVAAVQGPSVPHDQHLRRHGVRRVLRDDLRAAAVPAEPPRLQRLRERPRPVAASVRRLPRVEPDRQAPVPGGRAHAA
jgi:hypothetical protein